MIDMALPTDNKSPCFNQKYVVRGRFRLRLLSMLGVDSSETGKAVPLSGIACETGPMDAQPPQESSNNSPLGESDGHSTGQLIS